MVKTYPLSNFLAIGTNKRKNNVTNMTKWLLLAIQVLGQSVIQAVPLQRDTPQLTEREELIKMWAPVVWLHSQEQYYPSSIIDFLQHVKPSKKGSGHDITIHNGYSEIILPSLPRGKSSWDTHLLPLHKSECSSCPKPTFLYGKKPGRHYSPPIYAAIHHCTYRQPKEVYTTPMAQHGYLNDHGIKEDVHPHDQELSTTQELPQAITKSPLTVPLYTSATKNTTDIEPQRPNLKRISPVSKIVSNSTDSSKTNTTKEIENSRQPSTNKPEDTHTEEQQSQNTQSARTTEKKLEDIVKGFGKRLLKRNVIHKSNQQFSVTYWMFFPYNYGKDTCTTNLGFLGRINRLSINGACHGEKIPMGNHIGDWEHLTIHFKGSIPTQLYISSHTFGAYYTYDSHNHVFRYTSHATRKGIPLTPEYPPVLNLQENHPIVFTSLGSHGLWPNSGNHQYNYVPFLEDITDMGTPWKTWENLEWIDLMNSNTLTAAQRHWLSYEGHWGTPKSKCHLLMGGFCEVNQGPTGISRKRINFPCQ